MVEMCPDAFHTADGPRRIEPLWYRIYALTVRSDVPLLTASPLPPDQTAPDVVIQRHERSVPPAPDGPAVAWMPCPVHGKDMMVYRGPGGAWIWQRATGTFHVGPDARHVDVYPDGQIDERALALALTGPVLLFARHKLGYPSLHASAIVTARGAVAFLGASGQGKSTMVASFLRIGAALLTDDALPLQPRDDGVHGVPGPPFMKVWRETTQHTLDLADELPNLKVDLEKKLLSLDGRYASAETPARLLAVYVLNRYDPGVVGGTDVTIRGMSRRESIVALLTHTFNRSYMLPAEEASFLPLYTRLATEVPVRTIMYPGGFEYQDAVRARILEDVEEQ